ncbi:MAG: hypothetical protein LC797_08990 [Chloroflexi bacterium]|nr:hypothetical protein [Chloroflexota bacterium]
MPALQLDQEALRVPLNGFTMQLRPSELESVACIAGCLVRLPTGSAGLWRAICKTHVRTQAFLFAAWPTAVGLRGLAIEDAVFWCGVWHPRPDPISVDFRDAPPRSSC